MKPKVAFELEELAPAHHSFELNKVQSKKHASDRHSLIECVGDVCLAESISTVAKYIYMFCLSPASKAGEACWAVSDS